MTRWIRTTSAHAVEHGLPHRVQRVLHRFALVLRERLEQRAADGLPGRAEVDRRRRRSARSRSARSRGADRASRAASCIRRAGSRRTPTATTSESRRSAMPAPTTCRSRRSRVTVAVRVSGPGGRTRGRVRVRRCAMRPHGCSVRSTRTRSSRALRSRKCRRERERRTARARRSGRGAARAYTVFFIVSVGSTSRVVAGRVGLVVVALEPDGDGEIAQIVAIAVARDLHEPDLRFAVGRISEHDSSGKGRGDVGADHSTAPFTVWRTWRRRASAGARLRPTTTSSRRSRTWSSRSPPSSCPASSPRAGSGWTAGSRAAAGPPATTGASSRSACAASIRGVNVDTSYFTGNYPSHCSIDAARRRRVRWRRPRTRQTATPWTRILPKSPLRGDGANLLAVEDRPAVDASCG